MRKNKYLFVVYLYNSYSQNSLWLEKPLSFDPFGQTVFAHFGHKMIDPCKILVQGSKLSGLSCL